MKRRSLLYRALVIPVSAAAFTASGWLMGVRALTMPPPPEAPTPPPNVGVGQTYLVCGDCLDEPSAPCATRWSCVNGFGWQDRWWGCASQPCANGWCRWRGQSSQILC